MSRPVAIVPAAGASSRMGQTKALLPWGADTLLGYQLAQLLLAGVEERLVVVGAEAEPVAAEATRAGAAVVVNERWREGRASSVRAGAAAVPDDADPIIVLNVDQPRPAHIIRALLNAYRAHPAAVVVPVHEGRRGHPILFAGRTLPELRALREEDEGLRAVVRRHRDDLRETPAGSPVVHCDVNTPQDYEAALQKWEQETGTPKGERPI